MPNITNVKKLSRATNGEVIYYVYDGDVVLEERTFVNAEMARNVYGRNLIFRETRADSGYYSYNGHGDVVRWEYTNRNGYVEYEYDEFGQVSSYEYAISTMAPVMAPTIDTTDEVSPKELGYVCNPYRYAGYEYLEQIGIYDLNARYYNPEIARFLSADPYYNLGNRVIGLYEINVPNAWSIIQASNIYVYCGNSPLCFIDVLGLGVSYVIYDANDSSIKEDAEDVKEQMIEKYKLENVCLSGVKTKEDFFNVWNAMGTKNDGESIDCVIILLHGEPQTIFVGTERITQGSIYTLDKKEIDTLYLFSCNGGHLDYRQGNVATYFLTYHDINTVIAWDGVVKYDKYWWFGYRTMLANDQSKFYSDAKTSKVHRKIKRQGRIFEWDEKRDPKGELFYTKKGDGTIIIKNKKGKEQ